MTPDVEYTLERDYHARRELVFRAWTDPELLAGWFGPYGYTTPVERINVELRPGGTWEVLLVSAEGTEAPLGGTYREIDEPNRLVFTTGDPDNSEDAVASVVTLDFNQDEDWTRMTFHQAGYHTAPEHADAAQAGWEQFFDRLDEHLRDLAP
jgi:uncharacterized protein YndB with AHSA1/START domain